MFCSYYYFAIKHARKQKKKKKKSEKERLTEMKEKIKTTEITGLIESRSRYSIRFNISYVSVYLYLYGNIVVVVDISTVTKFVEGMQVRNK